jgi:hypothetical protein
LLLILLGELLFHGHGQQVEFAPVVVVVVAVVDTAATRIGLEGRGGCGVVGHSLGRDGRRSRNLCGGVRYRRRGMGDHGGRRHGGMVDGNHGWTFDSRQVGGRRYGSTSHIVLAMD